MRAAFKIGACFDMLLIGAFVALVGAIVAGHVLDFGRQDKLAAIKLAQDKEACSYEVLQAIRTGKTPDGVTAALNSSPYARKSCADFQVNGVPLIHK